MEVGDLVRNIHTGEIGLIIGEDDEAYGYVIVYTANWFATHFWSNNKELLRVINESR